MVRFAKDDVEEAAEPKAEAPAVEGEKALVARATITDGTAAEADEPRRSDLNLVTDLTGRLIRVEKVGV